MGEPPQKKQKIALSQDNAEAEHEHIPEFNSFSQKLLRNIMFHRDALASSFQSDTTSDIKFSLLPAVPTSAGQIAEVQLDKCFELIKKTSSIDYKKAWGWHPKDKKIEMRDPNMWYILLERDGSQQNSKPRRRLPNGDIEDNPEGPCIEEHSTNTSLSDSHLLGFTSFMFTKDDPPFDSNDVGYIYEIHLESELRGKGLGKGLVEAVERIVMSVGIDKTMLTVFSKNKAARGLYDSLGYERDSCSPEDRLTRNGTREAEYRILSKILEGGSSDGNPKEP